MKLADAWTSVVSISVGDISAIRFFISFFFYSQKFHRSSAYILHFDSTWLAVCLPPPHSHCKVSYPGTPHSCRNAPRPIFSVLICVINDVIDLLMLLWPQLKTACCKTYFIWQCPQLEGSTCPLMKGPSPVLPPGGGLLGWRKSLNPDCNRSLLLKHVVLLRTDTRIRPLRPYR